MHPINVLTYLLAVITEKGLRAFSRCLFLTIRQNGELRVVVG